MDKRRLVIVKAPAGLGKSTAYIEYGLAEGQRSKVIAVPTIDLKKQIYNDCAVKYGLDNFMQTPDLPKFKDKEIKETIDTYYKMGLHSSVKRFLHNKKKELEEKKNLQSDEKIDLSNITYYLEQNKLVNKFEGTVVTTQDRLFYFSEEFFKNHDIIIDEDILERVLKITKISMKDLLSFHCKDNDLYSKFYHRIMQITNADYERTTQLIDDNKVTENKVSKEVKEDVYDFDIMCVFEAKAFWKYNPSQEAMEFFKEARGKEKAPKEVTLPNSTDEIYFLEIKPLPQYDTILLSATVEENFYKRLFWDFDIEVLNVGDVKLLGKIKQFPESSCSRYDLDNHEGKFEEIRKKYPQIPDEAVITFKKYNTTEEALNFGKTEGQNKLEGRDLLIIGTPHCNEAVYKLFAYALDNYAKDYSKEKIRYQEVEYNNCRFWFNTYDDPFLREIQMWLINSELEQAVGRARLLRNGCTVYLYSSFPMKQAEFFYDDK